MKFISVGGIRTPFKRWNKRRRNRQQKGGGWQQPQRSKLDGQSYEERDVMLREMGYANYADYLASPLWRVVKAKVFKENGSCCCLCGKDATLVHHTRYHRNDLLGKCLRFMWPMCDGCHDAVEFDRGVKRTFADALATFERKQRLLETMTHRDWIDRQKRIRKNLRNIEAA